MRSLIFIILAGYAVRCDDASYYVIEMPEEAHREYAKPFRVYWNVPTMQCRSKKIPFDHLFDKYGIIQNTGDSFRGEKVAILYDPGLFPALLKNETSGKFKFRNGGVPQEGDLEKHLLAFRSTMEQSIPDENFNGIGIIDFESWRPVFRQNFGILIPYKDISYQIERKLHWFWSERAIQAKARQRFEESARAFMQTTLMIAKEMRPRALWGYYGFPYCFNMASNNLVERCADKVPQENDRIHWLWSESTALYPSVYSSKDLTSSQLAALVRGRMAEAARARRRGAPVLPYFWFRYRDGGFLSKTDLNVILETLYKSDASGFIIWGSSNDVNTVDKCNKLLKYTTEVMGPAIAKYTKPFSIRNATDSSYTTSNPVSSSLGLTTWRPVLKDHLDNANKSKTPFLDPEYHWEPPENYTQDIAHYVEQEFKKKPQYNADTSGNHGIVVNGKKNLLMEMIINLFKGSFEAIEHDSPDKNRVSRDDEEKSSQATDSTTNNPKTSGYSTEPSSLITPSVVTKNPLHDSEDNTKSTDYSTEGKIPSESFLSSTSKLSTYGLSSTPSAYTTSGYVTTIDKENDSSKIYLKTIQEKISTETVHTTEQLKKLDYIDELLDVGNKKASAVSENPDKRIIYEYTTNTYDNDKKESLELNITSNKNNTDERNYGNLLEHTPNLGFNQSLESTSEISLDNTENVTDISSTSKDIEVTSTSHEILPVPLFNELENKLATLTYNEIFEDIVNETTESYTESVPTSENPETTLEFILDLSNNEYSSTDEGGEDIIDDKTEYSTTTFQNIVLTTEPLSNYETTPSSTTELDREFIYDDSHTINLDSSETTTEDILRVPLVINKNETATTIHDDKLQEVEVKTSTKEELTERTETSTTDINSETEFIVRYNEIVPDSVIEDNVDGSTTEVTSTTNVDPQVVFFL